MEKKEVIKKVFRLILAEYNYNIFDNNYYLYISINELHYYDIERLKILRLNLEKMLPISIRLNISCSEVNFEIYDQI